MTIQKTIGLIIPVFLRFLDLLSVQYLDLTVYEEWLALSFGSGLKFVIKWLTGNYAETACRFSVICKTPI